MALSKTDKSTIRRYRLWSVMRAEDEGRASYERTLQRAAEVHNQHVYAFHVRNYEICSRAVAKLEEDLKLYPQ